MNEERNIKLNIERLKDLLWRKNKGGEGNISAEIRKDDFKNRK